MPREIIPGETGHKTKSTGVITYSSGLYKNKKGELILKFKLRGRRPFYKYEDDITYEVSDTELAVKYAALIVLGNRVEVRGWIEYNEQNDGSKAHNFKVGKIMFDPPKKNVWG